jgi:hypothetical protein
MMKNINTEIIVGLFMLAGFLAFGYLSLQMGEFSIFDLEKNYRLEAVRMPLPPSGPRGLSGISILKSSRGPMRKCLQMVKEFLIRNPP